MNKPHINVIFPMAGDGSRFGGTFKPFLDATEKKFIELAKEPFNALYDKFNITFIFVFRNDQEKEYNVTNTLTHLFPKDTLRFCILENKTAGPLETLQVAINKLDLSGPTFTCDCDHSVPVIHMIKMVLDNTYDIIIPVIKFKIDEYKNWGKVKLDLSGSLIQFYEKEYVAESSDYNIRGLIGCYYWKNISILLSSNTGADLSSAFSNFTNAIFGFVEIKNAEFFGTPEQLIEFRFNRAKKMTFLVDIDGTLIYLPQDVSYESTRVQVLPGSREKLLQWKNAGHRIILITGRETARREKLEIMLNELNIPYDELITGTNSGTRVVINDKKPYCAFHKMAYAVQLKRNQGISGVNIEDTPSIVKILKGASFATVYLIKKDDGYIVRKYIEKDVATKIHYETLLRQVDDLKRFAYLSPNLVPKILNTYESSDEYYVDMEYLDGYVELSKVSKDMLPMYCSKIIQRMNKDIYVYRKQINGKEWLTAFLDEKILAKYHMISELDTELSYLINSELVTINNKSMKGIKCFFSTTDLSYAYPKYVSPIHGDLTLENILVNENTFDIKTIDQSGSRYVDAKELDIAKMFQSILAKYEYWNTIDFLYEKTPTTYYLNDIFLDYTNPILNLIINEFQDDCIDSNLIKKALFFLGTYLIRMLPFTIRHSRERAVFSLLLSLSYLNESA